MAESSTNQKQVKSVTDCLMCNEVITDPRILPCIHTYCLKCISSYGADKQPGDELCCPMCNAPFRVPGGGIAELPMNSFVEKLLEVGRLMSSLAVCDVCDESCNATIAQRIAASHCTDCQQNLCQQCAANHRKIKATSSHELVPLESHDRRNESQYEMLENLCDRHSRERLKLFCMECKTTVCMLCYAESHKSHECKDLDTFQCVLRSAINLDVVEVKQRVLEHETALCKLDKYVVDCANHIDTVENEICKRADEMKKRIDDYKDSLILDARNAKRTHEEQVDVVEKKCKRQQEVLVDFQSYSQKLIKEGSVEDFISQANKLHIRARELTEFNAKPFMDPECFKSTLWFQFRDSIDVDLKNLFGHLDSNTKIVDNFLVLAAASHILSSKEYMIKPIFGLASLGDELFVIRKGSEQLEVYSSRTMEFKHCISLKGVGFVPRGLATCNTNQCVYIADSNSSEVYRLQPTVSAARRWSVTKKPASLSITKSHNLLVLSRTHSLHEFTTGGTLLREISLGLYCSEECAHVVQLADDLFCATYQDTMNHGFSVYGVGGKNTTRRYGMLQGSAPGQVNCPRGMAVNKHGLVFAADSGNNRIVVLNPKTFSCRKLSLRVTYSQLGPPASLVSGGLKAPDSLWLDAKQDRLYIGECEGGRVITVDGVNNLMFP